MCLIVGTIIKAIDIYQKSIYNMKQRNLCTDSDTEEHGMSYFFVFIDHRVCGFSNITSSGKFSYFLVKDSVLYIFKPRFLF